jgi:hypothetical protein
MFLVFSVMRYAKRAQYNTHFVHNCLLCEQNGANVATERKEGAEVTLQVLGVVVDIIFLFSPSSKESIQLFSFASYFRIGPCQNYSLKCFVGFAAVAAGELGVTEESPRKCSQ